MRRRPKSVTPLPAAVMQLQSYMAQRQAVEETIQAYAKGVKDALGLEGVWDLNVDTMTFTQRHKKEGAGT